MRATALLGLGAHRPARRDDNTAVAARTDSSDQWIRERSGIHERRVGGTTAGLSVEAGAKALATAGLEPGDIDILVLSTTTPDQTVPATSATVQHELGLTCGAFDVNAACAGFVGILAISAIASH